MVESLNIPEGDMKTDNAIIPSEWNLVEFQDVVTGFSSGATPYRGLPEYYKGNIKWITSGELNYNIITDTIEKITEEAVKNTNLKKHPIGTFLFAITGLEAEGTRGSCAITGVEATTNQSCMALFPKDTLDTGYLYHYYVWQGKSLALKYCQGTKQQSYTAKIARTLPIIVPNEKKEQAYIATALSDTDALIENLEKLITKKQNIRQGAMQKLLNPENNWDEKTIEEISDSKEKWSISGGPFGSNLKASDYTSEGIRIIQLQNIGDGVFLNDYSIYTSTDKANELLSCNIYPDEILLSKMGDPVARACIVPNYHPRYLMCSDGIRLVVDKEKYDSFFIYLSINAPSFRIQAENSSTGSTRKRIGLSELKSLKISCPTKEEQSRIAQMFIDIESEINELLNKLRKYRMIKRGMMQVLLTGQIRLK